MITHYIGSISELKGASMIALINSSSLLIKENIEKYTIEYFSGDLVGKIFRNTDTDSNLPEFSLSVQSGELITFSSIVFYDPNFSPIGFCLLDSAIILGSSSHSTTLEINTNFTEKYEAVLLSLSDSDISYVDHIINNSEMHTRLHTSGNPAASYKDLLNGSKSSMYTNSIMHRDRIHRFSGDFMINNNKLSSKELIMDSDESSGSLSEPNIISIGSDYYCIRAFIFENQGKKYIQLSISGVFSSEGEVINRVLRSTTIKEFDPANEVFLVGSNYIVIGSDIYSTNEILKAFRSYVSDRFDISSDHKLASGINKDDEGNDLDDDAEGFIKFTKNYITNNLESYTRNDEVILPLSKDLKDIVNRLVDKITLQNIESILSCGPNSIVFYLKDEENLLFIKSIAANEDGKYDAFSYPAPGHRVSEVRNISDKSFLVKTDSGEWKLILLDNSGFPGDNTHVLKSYKLGSNSPSRWCKLDLLSRSKVNPKDAKILMYPTQGRVWKYITDGNQEKITQL